MKDERREPWCWQGVDALALIRDRDRGKRGDLGLAYALAVYCTMTEIANEQRSRDEFRATRKEIAKRSGTSTKTVDRVVAELEEVGLIYVDRRPGHDSLWSLTTPGTRDSQGSSSDSQGQVEAPGALPEDGPVDPESPLTSKGQEEEVVGEDWPPATPKSSKAKEAQLEALVAGLINPADEGEAEVLADAVGMLRRGEKVTGQKVTPAEFAVAVVSIAAFNRCFEFGEKKGSSYGVGANLASVVQRARERQSWKPAKWVRLVEAAWRVRWWEQNGRDKSRRPGPQVIFSPKSFENVVQDAADEAAGAKPADIKKKRYRRDS